MTKIELVAELYASVKRNKPLMARFRSVTYDNDSHDNSIVFETLDADIYVISSNTVRTIED